MEWVDGAKLDDPAALHAAGVQPAEVAPLLTATFSAMVFEHGFVHCDPHAGNLLARRMPQAGARGGRGGGDGGGGAQLVLLDHGLYRRLSEDYRLAYAQLWCALLAQDDAAGRAAASALGVPPDDYETLAIALTFRPPNSRAPLGSGMSAAERRAIRARYASVGPAEADGMPRCASALSRLHLGSTSAQSRLNLGQVNAFLGRLPRDMLFVMRTWGLVRSLNRALGGTTRQRFVTMATYATRGAHRRRPSARAEPAASGAAWLPGQLLRACAAWRRRTALWLTAWRVWSAVLRFRARLAFEGLAARLALGEGGGAVEGLLAPGAKQFG